MIPHDNLQKNDIRDINVSLFIREAVTLKNEQQHLEKYQVHTINTIKLISGIKLNELYNEMQFDFKNKHNELIQNLKKIISAKNFLKNDVLNVHKIKEIDSLQCKNIVHNLNKDITETKTIIYNDLQQLSVSENILNEELDKIIVQIKAWDDTKNKHCSFISSHYGINKQDECDFYSFLYFNGGHEGGWTSEDHSLFLKIFKKYKTSDIVSELQNILPDISSDEILAHIDWYKKYSSLKKKHKQAIKVWKSANKEKQSAEINDFSEEIKMTKTKNVPIKNSTETKNKIMQWKKEKLTIAEDKLKELGIIESQKKIKEAQRKFDQKQMKDLVQKWKTGKIIEEQSQRLIEEQKSLLEHHINASEANKHIKKYQEQDDMFIQRKLTKLSKKCEKGNLKSISTLHVKRDPNRLTQATKQWIERTKHSDGIQHQINFYLNDIPKLKIPNWRTNL